MRRLERPEPLTAHLVTAPVFPHQPFRGDDGVLELEDDDLIPRQQPARHRRRERELVQLPGLQVPR